MRANYVCIIFILEVEANFGTNAANPGPSRNKKYLNRSGEGGRVQGRKSRSERKKKKKGKM